MLELLVLQLKNVANLTLMKSHHVTSIKEFMWEMYLCLIAQFSSLSIHLNALVSMIVSKLLVASLPFIYLCQQWNKVFENYMYMLFVCHDMMVCDVATRLLLLAPPTKLAELSSLGYRAIYY